MKKICFLIILFCLPGLLLTAADNSQPPSISQLLQIARSMEIAPMENEPEWVRKDEPLFRLGWFSDLHLIDLDSIERSAQACHQFRDELKPLAVLLTGDNCGLPDELLLDSRVRERDLARQLWLKDFLAKELALPAIVLPGDNWPNGFTEIFGPDKRSFDFAGIHFILFAMDERDSTREGCQRVCAENLEWLADDLKANEDKPAIFIMHEPLLPPTFLEADKLRAIIDKAPNLILALGGHLHLDLQFKRNHWTQWCAPSIGRSHRPAFKMLSFYDDCIIMTSYELSEEDGKFLPARKWQRVTIPEQFKLDGTIPAVFQAENPALAPHQGREENPELGQRAKELGPALLKTFFNNRKPAVSPQPQPAKPEIQP